MNVTKLQNRTNRMILKKLNVKKNAYFADKTISSLGNRENIFFFEKCTSLVI